MKYIGSLLFFLFVIAGWQAKAQSSREVNTQQQGSQYNSRQKVKKAKKLKPNKYDQLQKEYDERMKDNLKENKKEARLMEKPQYSDPSYFGHKRPPKKRPVGRRKFCSECGIVH